MALSRSIFKFHELLRTCGKIGDANHVQNPLFDVPVRTSKHWNPKWKWLRGQKFIPVDYTDQFSKDGLDKEKIRSKMKELGLMPPRYWRIRPMTITSTNEIMDPYVPPEGDGKASVLSKEGAKNLATSLTKKKDSIMAIRKIKRYEEDFNVKTFPQEAHDIYIKAHTTLMDQDPEKLIEFATEKAVGEMFHGLKYKTLRWKFIESLEPPIVVHVRVQPVITEVNNFAQVTVRFHTKQALAIYDRFGRLYYGSEVLAKDVLEYVVFEKHIVHEYGVWRLHSKIIPNWMAVGEPSARTYRIETEVEEKDEDEDDLIEGDVPEEPFTAESEVVKSETQAKN